VNSTFRIQKIAVYLNFHYSKFLIFASLDRVFLRILADEHREGFISLQVDAG